jgi:hypothetical protein
MNTCQVQNNAKIEKKNIYEKFQLQIGKKIPF